MLTNVHSAVHSLRFGNANCHSHVARSFVSFLPFDYTRLGGFRSQYTFTVAKTVMRRTIVTLHGSSCLYTAFHSHNTVRQLVRPLVALGCSSSPISVITKILMRGKSRANGYRYLGALARKLSEVAVVNHPLITSCALHAFRDCLESS